MKHKKQKEIKQLIEAKINVILEGEKGSGKSTIIKNIATELELPFYTIPMTKQTTLNALLGFISINGEYIPSQLRKAVEDGGIMLLDEIDAGDPNVLLALNTIENGYLAFPDTVVTIHNDFRLCATSNPAGEHQMYTGRSKLDAATLDRFDSIWVDRDPRLEQQLTSVVTATEMDIMRKILEDHSVSKVLSMRDAIRFHKRKQIGLADGYEKVLLGDDSFYPTYVKKLEKYKPKQTKAQIDCKTIDELWEVVQEEGKQQPGNSNTEFPGPNPYWSDLFTTPDGESSWTQEYLLDPIIDSPKVTGVKATTVIIDDIELDPVPESKKPRPKTKAKKRGKRNNI